MIAALLAGSLALTTAFQDPESGLLEPVELRALFLAPGDLDVLGDPARLAEAMDRLAEIGFDAVVTLAWERGRTLAPSPALVQAGVAESLFFPGRDVLTEIVFEAHRAGLEVLVAVDGSLALDPEAMPASKLALAPGTKDRPDPRDASVRALARAFALDMARAAEVDGLVLVNGLPAFTAEEARTPEAKKAADELVAWRNELRAFDPGMVVGWSATDARFAPPTDFLALDFVVLAEAPKDSGSPVAVWMAGKPGRAALHRSLTDATTPEVFAADLAAARAKPFQGEVLGPFAALFGRDGALTDVLTEGLDAPYYARATLPWRGGKVWRPAAEMRDMVDVSGNFREVEGDAPIRHWMVPAGQAGKATWEFDPEEKGPHELWIWLPPGHENPPKLKLLIPVDTRRAQTVNLTAGPGRGWVRVGTAVINQEKKQDVLILEVPAGGDLPVAVGPMVALPRRRAERR